MENLFNVETGLILLKSVVLDLLQVGEVLDKQMDAVGSELDRM